MKPRLILRRQLKPRYPDEWKPGGRTLDEWKQACYRFVLFKDVPVGAHFVIQDFVYRKVSEVTAIKLHEDTTERLLGMVPGIDVCKVAT